MQISPKGLKLLTLWEGCKLRIYLDAAGLPTIGVGHLIQQHENFSQGITTSQANDLLAKDLERFESAVNKAVKVPLNQDQFDALVAFSFNVGAGAFLKSTLLKVLNADGHTAVPVQLMRWTRAGGKECQGLVNRRKNEIKLWNGEL